MNELSPGEWAVLGAVAEGPKHGFAVAQLLAADGELGQVWTMPRPVVYQVIKKLAELGYVTERKTEPGTRGPVRTIVGVTPAGRRALRKWLAEPVDHIRDVRSLLLLKLALLYRSGADPSALVTAQTERVKTQLQGLTRNRRSAAGFERALLEWRIASSRATVDFLSSASQHLTS
ncbi:MAG TPA: PadR family transcriptional regulator [Acidimicrobiales bacterium]|nr:PadR family transcriptional regulator [Acidimicrobiales bacterium]